MVLAGKRLNTVKTNERYRKRIADISGRFRQRQLKAAVRVNEEMLRFYWDIGKDISAMSEDASYGSGFYKTVSSDLSEIFPTIHSFSATNLKYMRYYEMYPAADENRQQLVDGSGDMEKGLSH